MNKQKLIQALGIASKAGGLIIGTKLFEAIKKKKVYLVVGASDMGASQKKKLLNQCQYYEIPLLNDVLSRAEIARACGKPEIVAVGIIDLNLFQLIKSIIN